MAGEDANEAVARRWYHAFRRGDVDAVVAEMDPEVELHTLPEVSEEPYMAHEGIRRFFRERQAWDELTFQIHHFRSNGDCVAMLGRYRSRRGGVIHDSPVAWSATMRAGRVQRVETFMSWDDALEACGILEAA